MPKYYFRLLFILLPFSTFGYSPEDVTSFTEDYAYIAVQQMMEFDIPASIILAQAFLESKHGQSDLAQDSNNFFGIKAKNDWDGPYVVMKSVEYKKHKRIVKKSKFRKYAYPEDSWHDHSAFLASGNRYRRLFEQGLFNYKGWAHGLQKAGYATDPRYAKKLINLIEKHHFNDFDKVGFQLAHHIPIHLDALHPNNHQAIRVIQGTLEGVAANVSERELLKEQAAAEQRVTESIRFNQEEEMVAGKFYIYLSEEPKPIIRGVETDKLYKMAIR
ncbi:MAG TPA: hypothetical protein ENK85_09725 [Saprospiraceae bacterium]|nr:hypothetical protein [Saprospiraceae bacterium]